MKTQPIPITTSYNSPTAKRSTLPRPKPTFGLDVFVSNLQASPTKLPANSVRLNPSLRFSGYALKAAALKQIGDRLRGTDPALVGPTFFPTPGTESALYQSLTENTPAPETLINALAQGKATVINSYVPLLHEPDRPFLPKPAAAYLSEARQFTEELQREYRDIETSLSAAPYDFSKAEIDMLKGFIAKTAPVLFNMGFKDAISHAAQVCKLSVYKAHQLHEQFEQALAAKGQSLSPADKRRQHLECLQAAFVGWLHDPKLDGALSFENLAAHPVVASALAQSIFDIPAFRQKAKAGLDLGPETLRYQTFAQGVVEALSINNDSRWVTENVILKLLADPVASQHGAEALAQLKARVLSRLESPAQGLAPEPFNDADIRMLSTIQFKTGLNGIRQTALSQYPDGMALYRKILQGETMEPATLQHFQEFLNTQDGLTELTISALGLFSHHDEVAPSAQIPSAALSLADPMMLKLGKVAAQPGYSNLMAGILAYESSFSNNMRLLPKIQLTHGTERISIDLNAPQQAWHRAVYLGILDAAARLSPQPAPLRERILEAATQGEPGTQIQALRDLIRNPDTWGKYATCPPGSKAFQKAIQTIESSDTIMSRRYREAAAQNDATEGTLR